MRTYLIASVYGTVPGFMYERTTAAMDKLGMSLVRSGPDFVLTLSSNADYAAAIELGNELAFQEQDLGKAHVPRISAEELGMILSSAADDSGGDPHPEIFFKRSGISYQEPGPHVTPAAVKGMYAFMRRLNLVWHEASGGGR